MVRSEETRVDVDDDVLGVGVKLPSGLCVVDWNLEAFPPEHRLDNDHHSCYGSFADVEQGTGGTVTDVRTVFADE